MILFALMDAVRDSRRDISVVYRQRQLVVQNVCIKNSTLIIEVDEPERMPTTDELVENLRSEGAVIDHP